jgi:hypothetical protein
VRLVAAFGAGERDLSRMQRGAGGQMRVGLIGHHPGRAGAGPTRAASVDADLVQQWQQLRVVPGLPRGEDDRHRQTAPVDGEVDLAGQSASGPAEGFPVDGERFDPLAGASPF